MQAAAAGAAPVPPTDANAAPVGRKKRATKVAAAAAKQQATQDKLTGLETATASLQHAADMAKSLKAVTKRKEILDKHLVKVAAARADLDKNKKALEDAQAQAALITQAAAAKAAKVAEKADETRPMSREGIRLLTTLRLGKQKEMDDHSNKNLNIWDNIALDFNAKVDDNTLPAGDRRTAATLKSKFSSLDGQFKLHVRKIQARRQSGAPLVDIEEVENAPVGKFGVTEATDIFFKFSRQNRPGVVPTHVMNGGNAAHGGDRNSFLSPEPKGKRGEDGSGDEDDDDDDDDDDSDSGSSVVGRAHAAQQRAAHAAAASSTASPAGRDDDEEAEDDGDGAEGRSGNLDEEEEEEAAEAAEGGSGNFEEEEEAAAPSSTSSANKSGKSADKTSKTPRDLNPGTNHYRPDKKKSKDPLINFLSNWTASQDQKEKKREKKEEQS